MFGLLLFRWESFQQGHFMGKVLDEWIDDGQEFLHTKLPHLIVVALIALLLNKLLRIITNRMVRVAEMHASEHGRVAEVRTLAGVIRATGLAIIGVIVGLQVMAALGANLAPLLTSAGIAGVAIGLAAQTIVKDMLNGILILLEGQFNVGDTIKVAGVQGVVEGMTLRKTILRDGGDGTLYVIPNSQITTVANLSSDYSVATISVAVDFSANPDEVIALLKKIAMEVRNMPAFRDVFRADPQVLGVDAVRGSQLIFPVVFKTLATKQYAPVREFQRRVRLALEEHQMLPGDPGRVYGIHTPVGTAINESPSSHAPDPTTIKPQESNPFIAE